jgi:ribonuclease J
VPVYGTNMTLGLLRKKWRTPARQEHQVHIIKPKDKVKLGSSFEVEVIRINHSIADSVSFAIKTPVGTVVHTGDFKVDFTPIMGDPIDLARFGELGKSGVLALVMDSTNVERPGYTMSEHSVGAAFDSIFKDCDKRIIVATFSSNVDRVQQIVNAAAKHGRKVAVSGRSMLNMIDVAIELNYINIPKGLFIDIDQIDKYPPEKIVLITTVSQGEPMSALHRMAYSDHRKVEIGKGDLVIISANPIPGNERLVNRMVNELCKKGADVVNDSLHSCTSRATPARKNSR